MNKWPASCQTTYTYNTYTGVYLYVSCSVYYSMYPIKSSACYTYTVKGQLDVPGVQWERRVVVEQPAGKLFKSSVDFYLKILSLNEKE